MHLPKITVITPTYNAQSTIQNCIESVLQQDYDNIEYLIVDGLSRDNTIDIIKSFKNQKIIFFSEKDNGIYDALNKGIKLATGEWIYILGADDKLFSRTILKEIFARPSSVTADVLYGNVLYKSVNRIYDGEFNCRKLLRANICHQAMFIKKAVIERLGYFDIKYVTHADYVLNLKIFGDESLNIKYINVVVAEYNGHGISSKFFDTNFYENQDKLFRRYLKYSCLSIKLLDVYHFQFKYFKTRGCYLKSVKYAFLIFLLNKKYLGRIWQ